MDAGYITKCSQFDAGIVPISRSCPLCVRVKNVFPHMPVFATQVLIITPIAVKISKSSTRTAALFRCSTVCDEGKTAADANKSARCRWTISKAAAMLLSAGGWTMTEGLGLLSIRMQTQTPQS